MLAEYEQSFKEMLKEHEENRKVILQFDQQTQLYALKHEIVEY